MRFSVQLPTEKVARPGEFLTADAIGEMARAAESAGFDAAFVTDHPIPDDRWLAAGGHHALDPFVALAFAAAATRTLRLQTNVLVLPYRNPFLVAKAAATLDVASGGRLILGVAAGYLRTEFAALGADFGRRNETTDEAIEVLRRAWSEDGIALVGHGFEAAGNTALPRPVQKPRPPIWVGGNSRRAIRRAVALADGWLPFPAGRRMAGVIRTAPIRSLDDLAERIGYARAQAQAAGRAAPLEIGFVPFGFEIGADGRFDPEGTRAQIQRLSEMGVGWVMLNVPCDTRAEWRERTERFAESVIAVVR